MQATIYKIVGPEQNKAYIGSTVTSLARRMNNHRSDSRKKEGVMKLHDAMRQHGPETFTIEEIAVVAVADRYTAEGAHIAEHRARGELYNTYQPGRTNADRRRAWRAAHPELVKGQRQRRAARQRALVVHPEHQQQDQGDAPEEE